VNESDLREWRARNRSFEQIGAYWTGEFNLANDGGEAERVRGGTASASPFPTRGINPILGRDSLTAKNLSARRTSRFYPPGRR